MIKFANPYLLWLFLLFIPLIIWYITRHKNNNPTSPNNKEVAVLACDKNTKKTIIKKQLYK